jgi:inosine-uridine nucleoside N-ribohydrolase
MSDPDTRSGLQAVYTMGGRFARPGEPDRGECNFMLDAAGTAAALSRPLPRHHIVPVNITGNLTLTDERMAEMFTDRLAPIRQCCESWIRAKKKGGTGLHDPVTAACALHPDFRTWETGRIRIRFSDRARNEDAEPFADNAVIGISNFTPTPDGPHRLAVAHDKDRYRAHLAEVLASAR